MKLKDEDFELLKSRQYCDDPSCSHYQQLGSGNIRTYCRKYNQIYCNGSCKGKPFVVTKGTIFYGLKTPLSRVVEVLCTLSRGMGLNNTCALHGVTADAVLEWLVKAGKHVDELTAYMSQELRLEQVQIDEFWSFVLKKKRI
jgi:hypothetical protein